MAARHARVTLDLGTGDGRRVLAAARKAPDTLAIGMDANAAGMAVASRRALRSERLPNALFVVSAAERVPPELSGLAGEVTVNFPWGSLLRGMLGAEDPPVLAGVARLLAPGAEGTALLSVVPRDGLPPLPSLWALAPAYERHGMELIEQRPASAGEIVTSQSTWAKRLRAGRDRPVTLLRFRRVR